MMGTTLRSDAVVEIRTETRVEDVGTFDAEKRRYAGI